MAIKVGINGFGRIGRLALRASFDWPEIEFVQINDVAGDAATLAHLLEFDSVQGRWHHEVMSEGNAIFIAGKSIATSQENSSLIFLFLKLNIQYKFRKIKITSFFTLVCANYYGNGKTPQRLLLGLV